MKQFYLIYNLGINAIHRIRAKSQIFSRVELKLLNKIKWYIRKVSVGFVKCHKWSVASLACNWRTLDRRVRTAGGLCRPYCLYGVTTILASICVVSIIKVLSSCSCVSTAFCDTIWLDTDAISIDIIIRRRETVHRHCRSVCHSAIYLPQLLQASRQSLMGYHGVKIFDNRKKIDFKQMIIDV